RGGSYDCSVAAGVPAANGGAASAAVTTWKVAVVPPAGVARTSPTQGDTRAGTGSITLTFNSPIDHDNVEHRLTLEPPPAEHLRHFWSGTQLSVSFAGKTRTDYRLTLAPGAVDRYGDTIAAPFVLNFRTAPLPATVSLSSDSYYTVVRAGIAPNVTLVST